MKKVVLDQSWLESWKTCHYYDLQEIYGEVSDWGYVYHYWNRQRHIFDAVRHYLPTNSHILDVAAAQGNFTLPLAEMGYQVTWNDLREELAGYVAIKYEKGIVNYAPGNVLELRFNRLFDAILIAEIIEHVAYPDKFLQKIAQLVKPGGFIIMTTPNGEFFLNSLPKYSECADPSQFKSREFQPNSDGHIFLLHTDEIMPMAQSSYLAVKELRLFTNPLTRGRLKIRFLLKFLPKTIVDFFESITSHTTGKLSRKINAHMIVVLQKSEENLLEKNYEPGNIRN